MASKKTDDGDRAAKARAEGLAKKAAKAAAANQLKPSELPPEEKRPPRLRNFYKKEVAPALMKELNVPHDKVNVNGGACALGHPIGASGARIMVTLIHALKARGLKKGLATLCIGGGEGTAVALELV